MLSNQIAVQLYTVRDFCKSASELAQTAGRLRSIGFETAEVAGVSADISPEEIHRILSDAGLAICSAHESGDLIRTSPLTVIERIKAMGVAHVVYPFPAGVDFSDPAAVNAMVSDLDAAGAVLREHGCSLSYHNHAIEFSRLGNETLMDYIARATLPETLHFELDTYWIQFGGCHPVEWCQKAAGRLTMLHCKDYGFGANNQPFFAEIGYGNLDFPAIISAADSAGCQWYIVEQDTCPGDPFVSLEKSYRTMRECLCA